MIRQAEIVMIWLKVDEGAKSDQKEKGKKPIARLLPSREDEGSHRAGQ